MAVTIAKMNECGVIQIASSESSRMLCHRLIGNDDTNKQCDCDRKNVKFYEVKDFASNC